MTTLGGAVLTEVGHVDCMYEIGSTMAWVVRIGKKCWSCRVQRYNLTTIVVFVVALDSDGFTAEEGPQTSSKLL